MASRKSTVLVAALLCFCYAWVQGEDLQPLVKSAEDNLAAAKVHVEHMLNLSPLPNAEKIPSIVKDESDHLAHEIKKLANQLQAAVTAGDHKAELAEAVNAAVTHLNEAAATLEHAGSDLKQDNTHYYAAAESLLAQIKNVVAAGPCDEVAPHLKAALQELTHDVNNYQYGIHGVIGPHEGNNGEAGHHEGAHHHHHVHHHHGASSEEGHDHSSEESHAHHSH
ncbi:MOB kinase activator-like 2 [Homalodisca vitripennis]|uniref:MOB kinase activator-like 2 n=1 Tax=Homalodisca vitripennis TaxID=197043 RepID=UPI001EEB56D8|nr:MOB kinase activator-like 2 [Homalodisca vitripennis]